MARKEEWSARRSGWGGRMVGEDARLHARLARSPCTHARTPFIHACLHHARTHVKLACRSFVHARLARTHALHALMPSRMSCMYARLTCIPCIHAHESFTCKSACFETRNCHEESRVISIDYYYFSMHKFAVMLTSYVPYVCSAGAALCGVTLINPGGRGRGGAPPRR